MLKPSTTGGGGRGPASTSGALPEGPAILRAAVGIALYAGAFGLTFGAVAAAAGLSVLQAVVLSVVMFTGASQFAFIGVAGGGGSPFAAVPAALLLGLRNAFYGVPISTNLRPKGLMRLLTAHLVIDETTAMALAQERREARRYAFYVTGATLFVCWNLGTLAGALLGTSIDPAQLGLDAAAPAVFLALLWPQLRTRGAVALGLAGAALAIALIPLTPPGVPVIAAALLSIGVGLRAPLPPDGAPAKTGAER